MGKLLSGLVVTVVGGVIVWALTSGWPDTGPKRQDPPNHTKRNRPLRIAVVLSEVDERKGPGQQAFDGTVEEDVKRFFTDAGWHVIHTRVVTRDTSMREFTRSLEGRADLLFMGTAGIIRKDAQFALGFRYEIAQVQAGSRRDPREFGPYAQDTVSDRSDVNVESLRRFVVSRLHSDFADIRAVALSARVHPGP